MAGIIEAVKTLNSVARTILTATVLGAIGLIGWTGYRAQHAESLMLEQKQLELEAFQIQVSALTEQLEDRQAALDRQSREILALRDMILERDADIEKLDAAIRLLMVDNRKARLTVIDKSREGNAESVQTVFEFVELTEAGDPLAPPRRFEVEGDIVFVDSWVVKFDDEYIRQADLHRGTSLVLFRRIFGEYQAPRHGFVLDEVGDRPLAYGLGDMSEFEKTIWSDFWSIANDPDRAEQLGIRAAHGEAPSIRLLEGKTYLLQLRASDGLSIVVEPDADSLSKSDY
ncbi:MAG: hypothetical protein ACYTHJ_09140 [Planctomycetota bacterium]